MGAHGSRSRMAFRKEATWDTLDPGLFTGMSFESEDIAYSQTSQRTNNIRSDQQVDRAPVISADHSGGIETEFRASNLDDILPGFFFTPDWISAGTLGNNVDAADTTNTFTFDVGDTINIVAGQYIHMSGFANSANNGLHFVTGVAGQVVTVQSTLVTESAVAATLTGSRIVNGTTRSSYSIERAFLDIDEYFLHTGMTPKSLVMEFESDSNVKVNMAFVGGTEQLQVTQWGTGDPSAEVTTPIFTSRGSVGSILIDGAVVPSCLIMSSTVTMERNTEGKTGLGTLGFCNAVGKTLELSGEISMYFSDSTYYSKYRNATSFALFIPMIDGDGNAYGLYLPACQIDDASVNVTGKDDDIMMEAPFIGLMGTTEGYMTCLSRYIVP